MVDFPESALDGAKERIAPMVRKHTDDLYEAVMESVQEYLIDNATFNIRSKLETADREVRTARARIAELEVELAATQKPDAALVEAMSKCIGTLSGPQGDGQ